MPIGEEIAVTVVAHFIADHIKMQLGAGVAPIDQAIVDTARAHPDIEGLETTLRNWTPTLMSSRTCRMRLP